MDEFGLNTTILQSADVRLTDGLSAQSSYPGNLWNLTIFTNSWI